MMATSVLRKRLGAYSLISATALGISPPQPKPAIKRQIPNSVGLLAKPFTRVAVENNMKHIAMPFLRPILSASVPNTKAPNIIPNSA